MQLLLRLAIFLLFAIPSSRCVAQLTITAPANAQALAQKLVGEGVQISNVQLTGPLSNTGFFRNVSGTSISLDSGILLTSGLATGASGPSSATASTSVPPSTGDGDDDLTGLLVDRNQDTKDASVLEFDFVPQGDSIRFRYVFGSEEYPEWACNKYNDVFAFFLSGPGITGKINLALVPGTTIPVSINSINNGPGNAGGSNISYCTNMGAGSPFLQYYHNNAGNLQFKYDGHTVVLIATTAVTPCQTYHLKIAIADAGDAQYDSGVFLEARSLSSNSLSITNSNPVIGGSPYLVEGCHTGGITISRPTAQPTPQPATLSFSGTAINGTDVAMLPTAVSIPGGATSLFIPIIPIVENVPEGIEYLKIYLSAGGTCASTLFTDSITIQIRDYDTLAISPRDAFCNGSTVQLQTTSTFSDYQWSPGATLSNVNIHNPVATPADGTVYYCTATLGSCVAKDSVRFFTKKLELLSKRDVNCTGAATGEIRAGGGPEWQLPVQYRLNGGAYGSDSSFTGLAVGNYKIYIKDVTGCVDSLSVTLTQAYPDLGFTQTVVPPACVTSIGSIAVTGTGGLSPYQFALDGTSFSPAASFAVTPGTYTVAVRDANGCTSSHPVIVPPPVPLLLTPAPVVTPAGCVGNGSITVFVAGGAGGYQFSANGGAFQQDNILSVPPGTTSILVKDANGCQVTANLMVPITNNLTLDAGTNATICEGVIQILAAVSNATQFSWTGGLVSNAGSPTTTAKPDTTTTYYVTAILGACTALDSVTLTVWQAPFAYAGIDSSICIGKKINLSGSGGLNYSWQPAAEVSDPFVSNPSIQPKKQTDYSLMVQDGNGCWSLKSDSIRISVVPSVKAFAGRDTAIAEGQPLQLQGLETSNSGATSFVWQPVRGLSNPAIADPVAVLDRDITYQFILTTPEGCEGRDEVMVKVYKQADIYVPTAFTPNADGRNDILRPLPIGMKKLNYFRLYNRWGNLVFSTLTENRGWDGKINGKPAPVESFVWIAEGVDFKGATLVRKGTVTLIR
ncbi:MAG: type sorting protein [Flaviaesturariibacter sp.]|nr:type sorting protein [Flaviaesturariibacter sp.]